MINDAAVTSMGGDKLQVSEAKMNAVAMWKGAAKALTGRSMGRAVMNKLNPKSLGNSSGAGGGLSRPGRVTRKTGASKGGSFN